MPRSKRKPRPSDKSEASLSQPTESDAQQFPHAQYISVLGTYAVLVCFAAVALPPSSKWLGFQPIPQATSIDRPQHPLLNPITAHPTGTVITVSIGVFVITIWWAGWMRLWWTQEKHLTRIENNTLRAQEKVFVCLPGCIHFFLLLMIAAENAKRPRFDTTWCVCLLCAANIIRCTSAEVSVRGPLHHCRIVISSSPRASHTTATLSLSVLLSILTVYTPSYTLPLPKLNIPYVDAQISVGPDDDPSIGSVVKQHTWIRLFSERK